MTVTIKYDNLRHHPARYVDPVGPQAAGKGARSSEVFIDRANDLVRELAGNGWRFATPEHGLTWDEVAGVAHGGYSYASETPSLRPRGLNFEERSNSFPVVVDLRYLDDVYVYDFAPFEAALAAGTASAEAEGRSEWRTGEFGGFKRESLGTLVPAAEYAGGYEKPMYLIGRQLRSDEARLVQGRVAVSVVDKDTIRTVMTDTETGDEILVSENRNAVYGMKCALGDARALADVLEVRVTIDPDIRVALKAHARRLGDKFADDGILGLAN